MRGSKFAIGVMAPGSRLDRNFAEKITSLTVERFGARAEIFFHPQCFLSSGHFAGDDETRANAFLEIANDEQFDALWFARGGYGSCRLLNKVLPKLAPAARKKIYLGYSDAGALMGAMYGKGFSNLAHGPMPSDLAREKGESAILRALSFLIDRDPSTMESHVSQAQPMAAFNITILGTLLGTTYQPDLTGHMLMLEETSEYLYRIDRAMFHITSNPGIRRVAGILLGRCSAIPENDPDFGQDEEQVARHWCSTAKIPYLGRADIGHDVANKIVPFGGAMAAKKTS